MGASYAQWPEKLLGTDFTAVEYWAKLGQLASGLAAAKATVTPRKPTSVIFSHGQHYSKSQLVNLSLNPPTWDDSMSTDPSPRSILSSPSLCPSSSTQSPPPAPSSEPISPIRLSKDSSAASTASCPDKTSSDTETKDFWASEELAVLKARTQALLGVRPERQQHETNQTPAPTRPQGSSHNFPPIPRHPFNYNTPADAVDVTAMLDNFIHNMHRLWHERLSLSLTPPTHPQLQPLTETKEEIEVSRPPHLTSVLYNGSQQQQQHQSPLFSQNSLTELNDRLKKSETGDLTSSHGAGV
ncbi:unnamed protein product, partial [Dibothriocephalus latus]